MKKSKSTKSVLAAALSLILLLGGCDNADNNSSQSSETSSDTQSPANDSDSYQTPPESTGSGGTIQRYEQVISVADIKSAYGEDTSDEGVMPLYNVAPDEVFEFNFKADWLDSDVEPVDLVSVHTDPSCGESSRLYTSNLFHDDDVHLLRVSSAGGVLTTDTEDYAEIEGNEVWGNASMYYIAVWYDLDAETFTKLDSPIIIPFTIRHDLAVPTVKGIVDATGRFKLKWEPIEGADGYNIYWYGNVSPESHSTGEKNIPVPGAESAYDLHSECSLIKDNSTTETEFDNFSGKDHGLGILYHNELDEDDTDYIFGQNYNVNGSYFVSAVFGDKESGLSNIVNTSDLIIPFKVVEEQDPMQQMFAEESDLPQTVDVVNIDGSITPRKVNYTFHWSKTLEGSDYPTFRFTIEGTAITGECSMDVSAKDPGYYDDYNEGDAPRGMSGSSGSGTSTKADPDNETKFNPDADVPTIIEPTDGESSDKSLAERQIENTREHIENGNKAIIENTGLTVFADSAEEEWLARNLIAGNTEIWLEAFPSLQQYDTLMDVFYKAYYQNPYVLGVTSYQYDYATLTLNVNYCYDRSEVEQKQSEIQAEAERILGEMQKETSDEEKCRAIYDYFNDNTAYDDAAVEAAEAGDFTKGSGWKDHEDAFNAYGILVDKKGVCQSYALAYKLLCEMSGVENKVITGYLDGNLPHAWSAVKLDGEWYQIDCTNNETNCGIPFFLYEAGADDLAATGYSEDKLYELDAAVGKFAVENSDKEYYDANGLYADNVDGFKAILSACLDNTAAEVIAIRVTDAVTREEAIIATAEVYNMKGRESELETLGFGYTNGFTLLINNI